MNRRGSKIIIYTQGMMDIKLGIVGVYIRKIISYDKCMGSVQMQGTNGDALSHYMKS